jgi:hypothetical protein
MFGCSKPAEPKRSEYFTRHHGLTGEVFRHCQLTRSVDDSIDMNKPPSQRATGSFTCRPAPELPEVTIAWTGNTGIHTSGDFEICRIRVSSPGWDRVALFDMVAPAFRDAETAQHLRAALRALAMGATTFEADGIRGTVTADGYALDGCN